MIGIVYLVGIIINIFIFGSVLAQKKKTEAKLSFAFFTLFINIWLVSMFLIIFGYFSEYTIYLARLQNATTPIAAIFFVNFLYASFYKNKSEIVILLVKIGVFLSLITAIVSIFTDKVISSIDSNSIEYVIPNAAYGDWILLFAISIGYSLLLSFILIILGKLRKDLTDDKNLNIIVLSVLISSIAGLFTNVILPQITGNVAFGTWGPLAMVLVTVLIFYTILRHQFLDIRIILGRIIYYVLIGSLFYFTYFFIYFFDIITFGGSLTTGAVLSGVINAVLFAIIFVAFNNFLRKQVRSRIINPGYDPLEEQDQLSRKIAGQLSIRDISNTTLETLGRTIRAKYQGVLVIPGEIFKKAAEKMYLQEHGDKKEINIANLKTLYDLWEKAGKYPIIYDEIELEMPKHFRDHEEEIKKIMIWMQVKNFKVVVPVKESDENFAVLLIGQKEADSPYTNQDVDFLAGIASAIGLAITRALYYLEVEDLNKNLQKRVDDATKELSKKNKDLEDALDKLEEVRRQERDMIDVMGHELRTPITIVRNATLMVKSKLEKNAPKKDLLNYIEKAADGAKRELDLVETLLSATKVESNRIQMTLTKLDLNKVIEDAIFGHKHFADEKKLEIKYTKPKKEIFVYADKTRFQEVIDNLVSNAIKYTFEKGVEITVKTSNKNVQVAVKDHGIGISKEDMKKLGRKFYRAKQHIPESLKKGAKEGKIVRPGGTGLGLYVVFNLMKIMSGKVEVESEVGKGSTFTVTIPEYAGQEDKQIDQTFES